MPSRSHEIPLRVVQNHPALAVSLLGQALGHEVPDHDEALNTSAVLTNCDPKEWNADGAVVLRKDGTDVLTVVIERQNDDDLDKRFSWPAYLATMYGRLKCPAVLIVLCPDARMVRWSSKPIELGHPGFTLQPLVVGPAQMPVVTDPGQARDLPELAVLSAHAHGDQVPATLDALVEALDSTASLNRTFYYDYVLAGLQEAARKELEGLMSVDTYEWQSDFARKYVGLGREEGREAGLEEGREEGRRDEAVDQILVFLNERDLVPSEEQERRIRSCEDLETLRTWMRRVIKVRTVDELFA